MSITLTALMKQRYDTAANWTAANPTLLAGEIGIESDTKKWKLGTGAATWTSLGYAIGGTYPIVNADIAAAAAIVDTKLATIATAGKVSNSATTATNANTASAIVARDASGNFTAGTITAALTGNAATATKLDSSRTFAVTGDITGTVSSDLTSGASIATSIAAGSIVDADVNAAAAIAGTKISPNFGGQTIVTTGAYSAALGSASTPSLTFTGDLNTGIFSPGADQVAVATNGTGRLFINSTGQVGIGATPDATLTVDSGAVGLLANFNSSNANGGYIVGKSSGTPVWDLGTAKQALNVGGASDVGLTTRSGFLAFGTASAERLRITSAGLVGIGTSAPLSSFHLAGTTGLTWDIGATSSFGLATIGTAGTAGGSLLVRTATLNSSYPSGLGIDGTFSSTTSIVNLKAFGVKSNGYDSALAFHTSSETTLTERMRITSAGLVGIGTTIPGAALDVNGNIRLSAGIPNIEFNNGGAMVYGPAANTLAFATGGGPGTPSERARIDSSGRLLVGTSTVVDQGLVLISYNGGVNQGAIFAESNTTSGNAAIRFKVAGSTVGSITTTSSATAYNTSSDYRLKENVTAVTDGITRLQQLKPSRFNFIADPDHTVDGFIAHEVQDIVPEAITGEKDAEDDDGNPVYQGIDQSKLVPLLTAALQEAIAKIESLEARLTAAGI